MPRKTLLHRVRDAGFPTARYVPSDEPEATDDEIVLGRDGLSVQICQVGGGFAVNRCDESLPDDEIEVEHLGHFETEEHLLRFVRELAAPTTA